MVKGVTRRFIQVESPDPALFERAIFILKDGDCGPSVSELEREAQRITREYLRDGGKERRKRRLAPFLWALAGAGGTALLWLLVWLL